MRTPMEILLTAEPPGRGTPPVDMASLNIGQSVDGIAEQIETWASKRLIRLVIRWLV